MGLRKSLPPVRGGLTWQASEWAFRGCGAIARINLPGASPMNDRDAIHALLIQLEIEHRDLDATIARVAEVAPYDLLQLQRLKKRKLRLKDRITRLRGQLWPDIIA